MYGTIHTRGRGQPGRPHHGGHEGRDIEGRPHRGGHGHGGHGGHGLGGPRPVRLQMRRGAVRGAILRLLAEEPMHGYQVMQELDARSGGRWHPSAGSIYPTLQQLEDEGLVRATDQDGRRTFELTDTGRAAVEALPTDRPWAGRERDSDLRGLARELGIAAFQVTRVGSPAAVESARTILTDARKALYRILAEDTGAVVETTEASDTAATTDTTRTAPEPEPGA